MDKFQTTYKNLLEKYGHIMKPNEVRKELGLSEMTLIKYRQNGELKGFKLGHWRYASYDVAEYICQG